MIPASIIALLSLSTAIGLFREARKKSNPYYRLRWACMAFPFLYEMAIYAWVELWNPAADVRAPFIRSGFFVIVLCATFYFTLDLLEDLGVIRRQDG